MNKTSFEPTESFFFSISCFLEIIPKFYTSFLLYRSIIKVVDSEDDLETNLYIRKGLFHAT